MKNLDLFDLNKPIDLYRLVHEAYNEYVREPTERDFLFLALALTHLREWIAESSHREISKKVENGEQLTDGELFSEELFALHSFKVIKNLCNRSKHHITKNTNPETGKVSGLVAGLSRAGDSFGQTNFLIDGQDSRDYFIDLIHKYNEWFDRHG